MQNEEVQPKPKFATHGRSFLTLLSAAVTPTYYGFNCRPRQIKYRAVEKSVEEIKQGKYIREDAEALLVMVKANLAKAEAKRDEYRANIEHLEKKIAECTDSEARRMFRKERDKVETRMYNYDYDTVKTLAVAKSDLEAYLKD